MTDEEIESGFIRQIEDILKPRGFSATVSALSGVDKLEDIGSRIRKLICGDNALSFDDVSEVIQDFFTTNENAQKPAQDYSVFFNGISKDDVICEKDGFYDDKLYWGRSLPDNSKDAAPDLQTFFKDIFEDENVKCGVCIYNSKDPYISPSDAGTEDIEMFLNYTPPHVANRLTPYLEVQFISNRSIRVLGENASSPRSYNYLNTPGILRFLVGSVDAEEKLSEFDQPLIGTTRRVSFEKEHDPKADNREKKATTFTQNNVAGIEIFLAPQTLSNMDNLKAGDHATRLIDAKPFVPLASIINFEVTMLNAGSGDMVNKKAKLELKIHDKSRISEFSEFLKGGTGFATGRIWTSFGWLGPLGVSKDEDPWAGFINTKMHAEHCWSVYNSSFSFDQGGQVTLNLELTTAGVSQAKKTSIKARNNNYQGYLLNFQKLLDEIAETAKDLAERTGLGPDARLMQILNTAAAGQMLGGVEPSNVRKAITEVIEGYRQTGKIDTAQGDALLDKLDRALNPYYAGEDAKGNGSSEHPGRQGVAQARRDAIVDILKDSLSDTPDPFLPKIDLSGVASQGDNPYFNSRYMEELYYGLDGKYRPNIISGSAGNQQGEDKNTGANSSGKDQKQIERVEIKIPDLPKYVSFGKIYVANVIPAFLEANPEFKSDPDAEIQVLFYRLNDECGPVSGQSVAEFACDIERFSYQLDDQLKILNKHDLTIDEFSKLLIKSQFNDMRAVGYGKLSRGLYKPFDRNSTEGVIWKENPGYEGNLVAWQAENPVFAPPVIETYIEVIPNRSLSKINGEAFNASRVHRLLDHKKDGSIEKGALVRFHIYDRQANSKYLFKKFVEFSGRPEIGALDDSNFRQRIKNGTISEAQIQTFLNEFNAAEKKGEKLTRDRELEIAQQTGVKFKSPTGVNDPLIVNRKLFGAGGIRESLRMLAPTLEIGANGTLITSVNVASKANDLGAAAFLVRQIQSKPENKSNSTDPPPTGLEDAGGLPMRTFPATLNVSCIGVPIARPYQDFFIDLGTGTTLDNLYTCKTITHQIQPGKFVTNMEFMYADGYGKFAAPPTIQKILAAGGRAIQKAKDDLQKQAAAAEEEKKNAKKKKASKKAPTAAEKAKKFFASSAPKFESWTPTTPTPPPASEPTAQPLIAGMLTPQNPGLAEQIQNSLFQNQTVPGTALKIAAPKSTANLWKKPFLPAVLAPAPPPNEGKK